ncbi:formate C-acetyltransferase/glycerol dehydratase family glycyl radical enzyme [Treponema sp.]
MNDRLQRLKDRILLAKPSLCLERARIYTRVYQEEEALPIVRRRALALRRTLEEMSIRIDEDELIVGNHAHTLKAAPIFPEYAVNWILKEIDSIDNRPAESYFVSDAEKAELKEICTWWKGKTLQDRSMALLDPSLHAIHETGMIRAEGNMTSGDGHIAIDLAKLLSLGIAGYQELVEKSDAAVDTASWEGLKKRQLYLAMKESLAGFSHFIARFEELARSLAKDEGNKDPGASRRAELTHIADTCAAIVTKAPKNFRQALQLSYFSQLVLQLESNGHSLSLGRMDQYLYPFFKKDIDAGLLTQAEARELLSCTWLKLLEVKKVRSWSHTRYSAGGPLYQNVTIGGVDVDGKDAVNELSFLILESVGDMRLTQPNLTVRYHSGMSSDFMKATLEVIRKGFGMPAFNNDEVVIPGMVERGVSLADARSYSAIGCIEVAVPGKWGYRTTGMSFLNLMRVFLATLDDGKDATSGQSFLSGTGRLEGFETFDQLMAAFKKQTVYFTRATVAIDCAVDTALEELVPDILLSTLSDDCIERGKHLKEGGAVYDYISGLQVGLANLGNSLAAIRKFVFEEKSISAGDLMKTLREDFAGPEGEALRLRLLNKAPKYGNDDDAADELLVEAYGYFVDEIVKYKNTRYGRGPIGGAYYPGTSSISANVPSGSVVKASPDGRKAGTPLAEGSSPSSGTDVSGPTAVFKSVAKLPSHKIFGGVLLNQKLSPSAIASDSDKEKLISMIRTFFDELAGWHVQYNIVSRSTLLDAKSHPEKHRDLVVRVAGYSAFFNDLASDQQDDIIARTEHELRGN